MAEPASFIDRYRMPTRDRQDREINKELGEASGCKINKQATSKMSRHIEKEFAKHPVRSPVKADPSYRPPESRAVDLVVRNFTRNETPTGVDSPGSAA